MILRLNPLKSRLPSDVTFVRYVLRHRPMCWTFSIRYNIHVFKYSCVLFMFVLFVIYCAKYFRHYLSKTIMGRFYVVLKRKWYPLYMRRPYYITCGPVFVVTKIPVSVNLPT